MTAPAYPGYASPCNGCGQCCLDRPCPVAQQFGLWRDGACRALAFRAGRYWCDVAARPERVATELRKIPKPERLDALGIVGRCDARRLA